MNLEFSPEEIAFREEVRTFIAENYPKELRGKQDEGGDMTKEDLLNLAHAAIEEEDFETDVYDETLLPNPAHRIIYQQINGQLMELHNRRAAFQEEVRNIYKDAYNKYCVE